MRTFPLPALLVLLAAAPATRPAQVFNSDEFGFRLRVPADWIVPEHPDEGQVFTVWMPLQHTGGPATRPSGDLKVGGAGLRIEQGPAGGQDRQTLRDLTDTMAAQLFHVPGARHVAVRPAELGQMPARQVGFVIDRPGGPVAVLYVVGVHRGVEYVFNAAAPADQFDALLPPLRAMLGSFDLRD